MYLKLCKVILNTEKNYLQKKPVVTSQLHEIMNRHNFLQIVRQTFSRCTFLQHVFQVRTGFG